MSKRKKTTPVAFYKAVKAHPQPYITLSRKDAAERLSQDVEDFIAPTAVDKILECAGVEAHRKTRGTTGNKSQAAHDIQRLAQAVLKTLHQLNIDDESIHDDIFELAGTKPKDK